MTFGAKLTAAMADYGPLCVGIDPHATLLEQWGLPDDLQGLRSFSLSALDELAGVVAAIKPQAAFFERHGSRGMAVLEEVLAAARERELLTILDIKRGDIGSTMAGYAQAYLADGAPLAADAITLSPYLGVGSLAPAFDLARQSGRGVFVLALTSNPEGRTVQHAREPDGTAVAARVVREVAQLNARPAPALTQEAQETQELGSFGLVVGATVGAAPQELGIDLAGVNGPILAPGVGAQGGGEKELREVFGAARGSVLATTSRAVLQAGPAQLREAARDAAAQAQRALRG